MLAKVRSCAVIGLEGALIEVEVDLSNGLAGFMIVGLPNLGGGMKATGWKLWG